MKLVTAVIKPYQLDAVKEALHALGVAGLTVSEVQGTDGRRAHRGVPGCRVHGGVPAEDQG
jgi:nitrogen regulatory protein P-II 1